MTIADIQNINLGGFSVQYLIALGIAYFPIAAIGVWRWSIWLMKKCIGAFYKPIKAGYKDSVSLITPIYNEKPEVLEQAFASWIKEGPNEIIAVIDHTDKSSIEVVKNISKTFKNLKIIITEKPGKREALADGIIAAKCNIIALVDCDTIWTKDTMKNSLAPFADEKVGGVATRQNVIAPNNLAQAIFDMQLDLRYFDEMPFLTAAGDALTCLSGRTAFYRATAVKHLTDKLITEIFMGKKAISGDDKRLTFLIQEAGWKTVYQHNAVVLTFGADKVSTFLKQRIRWGRNSWRANLTALKNGWVWRHRALSFFVLDQFIQPFTLILGLFYLFFSVIYQQWTPAIILLAWWGISRTVKLLPHFVRHPKHILYIPAYIVLSYPLAILKIYSLMTINTHSWVTRWDKSRIAAFSLFEKSFKVALTAAVIALVGIISYIDYNDHILTVKQPKVLAKGIRYDSKLTASSVDVNKLATDISKEQLFIRYPVEGGDTILSISEKFNVDTQEILALNVNHLPNWNNLEVGNILTIPTRDVPVELNTTVTYQRRTNPPITYVYDEALNLLTVKGRGHNLTLREIAEKTNNQYLKEVEPGVWYLTSSLYIGNGITLDIDGTNGDVTWLKMASNKDYYVYLKGYGANIYVTKTKVTSWDEYANDYDYSYEDKRAYMILQNTGRMDIYDSEVAYLGFKDLTVGGGTYGVSWRVSSGTFGRNLITGEVINSKFHNNYFGIYTFGATGMVFRGNEFANNVVYGLDPHDDSNNFLVENNIAYGNAHHGIIFSKRCFNNVIRNNISYNNGLHGIMLHEKSDQNLVEGNIVYGNTDGIAIYDSNSNLIRNNQVYDNQKGIRINRNSNSNIVEGNEITNTELYAVYIYGNSKENIISNNIMNNAKDGIYLKMADQNEFSGNTLTNVRTAAKLADGAVDNKFIDNSLHGTYSYVIHSQDENYLNYVGPRGLGDITSVRIASNQ
jgi:parallel beta-helix repeat protein